MTKLGRILALVWYVFLCVLPTFSASPYCTNNSEVDTETKPEGMIVFPSTLSNTTVCHAEIRSPLNSKTQLTLVNLRELRQPSEPCLSSIKIYSLSTPVNLWIFCKSVGSRENITVNKSIRMVYKPSFRNEVDKDKSKNAISVNYKRLEATKACRHVLKAPSGEFGTKDMDSDIQQGECEWVINTGGGEGISLEFNIMNADYLNCENNFIEVRQGETIDAPELAKICRSYSRTLKSSSTKLWIRMKSSTTNGIRFSATYKTDTCKVVVANKPLDFESSSDPSCQTWNLTAGIGHIAALSFSSFDLVGTHSTSCAGNVLEVWDGMTKTSYCSFKPPPSLIVSKGRKLVVTYRSKGTLDGSFQASFTSIFSSSYKTNCVVIDRELSFRCTGNDKQVIPCSWQCDGAMQCSDNSDESNCSDMQERWHKLQVFVIVIGSICASTVIFCIVLICFRKCIVHSESTSPTRLNRNLSVVDHSLLTPNADLPSPPPCYFTDRDEEPPASVIRGTYFFGDEFSQSGIHSASLFGIPPPRYRSTESLHRSNSATRSIWQRGISSIPLIPTENPLPEENPPDYESLSADKEEQIMIATQNNESIENVACSQESHESSSSESIVDEAGLHPELSAVELQTNAPITTSLTSETVADNCNSSIDIGMVNVGAALNL